MNQAVEQAIIVDQPSLKPHPFATHIAFFNPDGTPFSFGEGGGGVSEEDVTNAITEAIDGLASEEFVTDAVSTLSSETTIAIQAAVDAFVDGAPGALNTLNELAAAINDDASFAAAVTTALGLKVSGPASATDARIVLFDGTSGKLVKVGSQSLADIATAWAAGDTAVISAYITADGVVTAAFQAADVVVTNAYIAADKVVPYLTAKTADWTLDSAAAGGCTPSNKATAISATIDSTTGWSAGQVGEILTVGAGQTTVVQGSGATLRQASGLKSRAQWTSIFIRCIASNEYVISGDTSA